MKKSFNYKGGLPIYKSLYTYTNHLKHIQQEKFKVMKKSKDSDRVLVLVDRAWIGY